MMPGSKGELKWIDNVFSGSITAAGAVQLCNGVAPGTSSITRIGRKIVMKSVILKTTVGCGTAGAALFRGKIKFSLVYDSQANATAPVIADIYASASANSNLNLDNRGRFKVLWKKCFAMDQSGGLGSGYNESTKVINLPTIFNAGTAGTVADIQTGALYLVTSQMNASGAVATNSPDYNIVVRVRFADD